MLPKHDLHLKLSKDKKTFTGMLSQWSVSIVSPRQRSWIANIAFLALNDGKPSQYQTQETYESKLALDALLKTEGLPTLIGIAEAAQTYLSFLDVYSIRVTWDTPPLSSARGRSMRDLVGKPALSPARFSQPHEPPRKTQTPPLAPVRRSSNAKRSPASRPPVHAPALETRVATNAYPLWETSVMPELPKGSWYGD